MRTFHAPFIVQKNATFAKPMIAAKFESAPEFYHPVFFLNDLTVDVSAAIPNSHAIVIDFGTLGASLEGFGEAFATASTTVTVSNAPAINGKRFGDLFGPFFSKTTKVTLFWIFQDPNSPTLFYTETALKGPMTTLSFTYDTATFTVESQAEELMSLDLLKLTDKEEWPDCPESNQGRPLPLIVNSVHKLPMWLYSGDRSRLMVCEDLEGVDWHYTFGGRYWRGTDVFDDEDLA